MILSDSLHLRVARTWDGRPIPDSEHLVFHLSGAGANLWIRVEAPFHGDPPPPGEPGPTDRLWRHEVAELFIAGEPPDPAGDVPYLELELSPRGHYLLLRLRGIRQVVDKLLPLRYTARIQGNRWSGEALLPGGLLPPPPHRVNAYAINGTGDARRYLAMTPVPGPAPDFHRLEAFAALELPRP